MFEITRKKTETVEPPVRNYTSVQVKFDSKYKDCIGFVDQQISRKLGKDWTAVSEQEPTDSQLAHLEGIEKSLMPLYLNILLIRAGMVGKFIEGDTVHFKAHYQIKAKTLVIDMESDRHNLRIEMSYVRMYMTDDFLKLGHSIESVIKCIPDEHFVYIPDELKHRSRLSQAWDQEGIVYNCLVQF